MAPRFWLQAVGLTISLPTFFFFKQSLRLVQVTGLGKDPGKITEKC